MAKPIHATLCFLVETEKDKPKRICLAMKKRGFGTGKWNGAGGKLQENETPELAAQRETFEEIGVQPEALAKVATLTFIFPYKPTWGQIIHVYLSTKWVGEPTESEEMKPEWFDIESIPYDKMWTDDEIWLPHVLNGKTLEGSFSFAEDESVLEHTIKIQ